MAGEDTLHGDEANASAGELALAVQTMERLEDIAGAAGIEAGAVIAHKVDHAAVYEFCAELDAGLRVMRGVLPGVAQQVVHDDAHQPGVGLDIGEVSDDEISAAGGLGASQIAGNP